MVEISKTVLTILSPSVSAGTKTGVKNIFVIAV